MPNPQRGTGRPERIVVPRLIIEAVCLLWKNHDGSIQQTQNEKLIDKCGDFDIIWDKNNRVFEIETIKINNFGTYLKSLPKYSTNDFSSDEIIWLYKSPRYSQAIRYLEKLQLVTIEEAQRDSLSGSSKGGGGPRTNNLIFCLGPFPSEKTKECLAHFEEVLRTGSNPLVPENTAPAKKEEPPEVRSPLEMSNGFPAAPEGSFVGVVRTNDLEAIHQHVTSSRKPLAITGMGGIGKSTLAREYLLTYAEHYPGGICWVPAYSGEYDLDQEARDLELNSRVHSIVEDFGPILGITVNPKITDARTRMREVWRQLPDIPTLFIFDDMKSAGQFKPFLPSPPYDQKQIFMLCTSRMMEFGTLIDTYPLKLPSVDDALTQLKAIVGAERIEKEADVAVSLLGAETTDRLPLAVLLLGSYLNVKAHDPLIDTQERLWRIRQEWTPGSKTYIGDAALEDIAELTDAQKGLRAIFQLTWNWLPEAIQQVAKIIPLFSSSFVDWEAVTAALSKGYEALGYEHLSPVNQETAEGALTLQSLITRTFVEEGTKAYTYHQLIGEFIRSETTRADAEQWLFFVENEAIRETLETVPNIREGTPKEEITKYARRASVLGVGYNRTALLEGENVALVISLSYFYARTFGTDPAIRILEETKFKIASTSAENRGIFYTAAAQFYEFLIKGERVRTELSLYNNKVNQYFETALLIHKKEYGEDHIKVAETLYFIGESYTKRNLVNKAEMLKRAEACLLESLEIQKVTFGVNALILTKTFVLLADIYISQERFKKALLILKRSLEIINQQPEENANTNYFKYLCIGKISTTYLSLSLFADAERMRIKAIQLIKHFPQASKAEEFASCFYSLGIIYHLAQDWEKTILSFKIALKLYKSVYGDYHQVVTQLLGHLAMTYFGIQDDENAVETYLEVVEVSEKTPWIGPDIVNRCIIGLAESYLVQAKHHHAERILKKVHHKTAGDKIILLGFEDNMTEYHKVLEGIRQLYQLEEWMKKQGMTPKNNMDGFPEKVEP
ncbi:MAG: NB-ARC domain-containing protein [Verrucomicrobiota bacterium]